MANQKIIKQKEKEVNELADKLKEAKMVLLTDYRGINVADVTKLRADLRPTAVEYKVIKNNIIRRALEVNGESGLNELLEGPTAIAVSNEDATAPARVLYNFAKDAEALELKAGVVEGTYYDADGIKLIATIPSREELLSKFLGSIQSPITNFARVIKQIAEKEETVA